MQHILVKDTYFTFQQLLLPMRGNDLLVRCWRSLTDGMLHLAIRRRRVMWKRVLMVVVLEWRMARQWVRMMTGVMLDGIYVSISVDGISRGRWCARWPEDRVM
jgi:hypothetical protein